MLSVQDHCPSAGAVGAANPGTCTYIDPLALQLNTSIGYNSIDPCPATDPTCKPADGPNENGAIAGLSQEGCYSTTTGVNNPNCCVIQTVVVTKTPLVTAKVPVCASWAGSHLSSQGCIQYGILETEAKFSLPMAGGGLAFFGTYMLGAYEQTGLPATGAQTTTTPDVRIYTQSLYVDLLTLITGILERD